MKINQSPGKIQKFIQWYENERDKQGNIFESYKSKKKYEGKRAQVLKNMFFEDVFSSDPLKDIFPNLNFFKKPEVA